MTIERNLGAIVPFVPYPVPVPIPVLTGTTCCIALDTAWIPYVVGCAKALANTSTWRSSSVSDVSAVVGLANQLLSDLMNGCDCVGPKGDAGSQGAPGIAGSNGSNGVDGVDGTNGTNGRGVSISNGVVTANPGSLSLTLTADLPTVGSTIDNYVLSGNIPPYVDIDVSTTYLPLPADTASICDISDAISNDITNRFNDFLNAYDAQAVLTSNLGAIAAGVVSAIPFLGPLAGTIITAVSDLSTLTSALARAGYTVDFKFAVRQALYCVMNGISARAYSKSIQDAWFAQVALIVSGTTGNLLSIIFSHFVDGFDVAKVSIVGAFAVPGSGDCALYDCGTVATYPWSFTFNLATHTQSPYASGIRDGGFVPDYGFGQTNSDGDSGMQFHIAGRDSTTRINAVRIQGIQSYKSGAMNMRIIDGSNLGAGPVIIDFGPAARAVAGDAFDLSMDGLDVALTGDNIAWQMGSTLENRPSGAQMIQYLQIITVSGSGTPIAPG